jgi:nucleolar GTP-binding protein
LTPSVHEHGGFRIGWGRQMKVSWKSLPTVLLEDEILDKAFSRAKKAADRVEDQDRTFRVRKQLTRMVQTSADVISTQLLETVNSWPSLDQSAQFDLALIDACVGCDEYRHHLSNLQWAANQVMKVSSQNTKKITRTARTELMHEARKEAYGRISSIVGQVSTSLLWLNEARETLKKLPTVDQSLPVIVVCGAPNVGKSAFISALSTGNMEVNHYPFTTKQIHVGHFTHRRLPYQMVDTPGLLDRPMVERNAIEMQAIAALENIGSLVLFLIDKSEQCGTPLQEQMHLLEDVRSLLGDTPTIVVTSKADLIQPRPSNWDDVKDTENEWRNAGSRGTPKLPLLFDSEQIVTMSAIENVGLDSMRLEIIRLVNQEWATDPLQLPDGWHRE